MEPFAPWGAAANMIASPVAQQSGWILALHSSTPSLGIGLQQLGRQNTPTFACFPLGRSLSNQLIPSLESVLPADQWPAIARLCVATGPGGFTGTRLTVTLARTLAQQLALPLDGISSFLLMASRLQRLGQWPGDGPGWLVQQLPRRGLVAGLYSQDPQRCGQIRERCQPRLFQDHQQLAVQAPDAFQLPAEAQLPEDVVELLNHGLRAAESASASPWRDVLPIYPTSPVDPTPC